MRLPVTIALAMLIPVAAAAEPLRMIPAPLPIYPPGFPAVTGNPAVDAYQQARLAWSKQQRDRAIMLLTQAITLNPDYKAAYDLRSLLRGEAGDLDGSIADLDEVVALSPSEIVYQNRGQTKLLKNDLRGAVSDFSLAIRVQPRARAIMMLAQAYGRLRDFKSAIAVLDRDYKSYDVQTELDSSAVHILRGSLYLGQGLYKPAFQEFDAEVVANRPTKAAALYARGQTRLKLGEAEAGRADLDAASAINPKVGAAFAANGWKF